MAKFSKTKKQSTFTKTEYKLTDEELQRKNSEAAGIVQQYDEKIASGGYLSAEDLYGYQEAQRTYIDTGNAIRKRLTENGYKFTDADEAEWATQVAGLNERYDKVYGVYSPHTSEDSWKAYLAEIEQHKADLEYDTEAGRVELAEIHKQIDAAKKDIPGSDYYANILPRKYGLVRPSDAKLKVQDLEAQAKELEDRIVRAEGLQAVAELESYSDPTSQNYDPDFEEKSVYDPTKRSPKKAGGILGLTSTYDSDPYLLYAAINGDKDAIAQLRANAGSSGASSPEGYNPLGGVYFSTTEGNHELVNMDEKEKKTYNYLAHEYGIAKADEYYELIRSDLFARERYADLLEMQAYTKEHPVAASVSTWLMAPLKGLSYMGQAIDYIDDGRIDENAPYNKFTYTGSDIRNTRSGMIEESWDNALGEGWGKVGSWGYQLGMSMGDFVMATAVSGGNQFMSLAIMGTGAAADMTIAAKQRGLSDDQAFALGTVAGAAEVITEKIGLDALFDVALKGKGALVYTLKNAFSEGLEEPTSSVINTLADLIISGDKAELVMKVQEYIDAGVSEGVAVGKVLGEYGLSLLGDAAGGMLSGGFMAIPGSISMSTQYRDVGAQIIKKGTASELKAAADTLGVGTKKFNLSKPGQVGQLYYTVAEKISESGKEALAGEMVKNGVSQKAATKLSGVIIDAWMGVEVDESGMDLIASALKDDNITGAMEVVLNGEDSPVRIARAQLAGVMESAEVETVAEDTAEKTTEPATESAPETFDDVQVEDGALVDVEQEMAPEEVQEETAAENHSAVDSAIQGYISSGSVTNRTAESILADPQALDYLQKETGVLITGSVAQKRAAVKAAVTQLAKQTKKGKRTIAPKESEQKAEPKKSEQTTEKKVDMEGKTFLESSGEEVKSISVKRIGKGGAVVTVNGGTEAKLSDVSFGDERTHLAYSRVTSVEGMTAEAANKILNNPKAERFDFINEAIRAFQGGLRNESVAEKLDYDIISADEARALFEEGRKAAAAQAQAAQDLLDEIYQKAKAEVEKTGKKVNAELRYADDFDIDELLEGERGDCARLAARMVPALRGDIVLYDGPENGKMGYYKHGEDAIYLNVNAKFDEKSMMAFVLAHEMVHRGRKGSALKYQAFADLMIEEFTKKGVSLDVLIQEQLDAAKAAKVKMTEPQAFEEVICDACQRMLVDTNAGRILAEWGERSNQNRKFLKKLKEFLTELFDRLRKVFAGERSENRAVAAFRALDKSVQDMLAEMYVDMTKDAAEKLSVIKAADLDITREFLASKDISYNLAAAESHKAQLSEEYSENATVPLDTLMQRYDKILRIWKAVGIKLDSKFLNEWNSKVGTDQAFSVFKAQSGYKYNIELSTMCKKGVALFEAIDTIVRNEIMKEIGTKVLGKAEKEILYDILKSKGFEIPCAICYVEQARQREGVIIDAFLNGNNSGKLGWNSVLDSIEAEMAALGMDFAFPQVSREIATEKYTPANLDMDQATQDVFFGALMTVANKEIERYNKEAKKNRPLIKAATRSGIQDALKGNVPANLKIFKVLAEHPSARFRIEGDLLYSSMTTRNLAGAHQQLYSLFNAQGGVSGYKTKQTPVVYWGDLLGKKWRPSDLRKGGGIRNQSNSDHQMYTLLDQVQMYIDLTAKGYYLQAYTKVVSELKLLGLSRAKMNASLIPKVVVYYNNDGTVDVARTKENAGLDENGNPIFDDFEGINSAEAFMLIADPEYSKSIGGVCIGYSDKHIWKLLDDARVQLIIGFHDKTNDPNKRYRGARYAKNYNGLNEAKKLKADGKYETVHVGFNRFVQQAEKMFRFDSETETYSGTVTRNGKTYTADDIPRLAADLYLEKYDTRDASGVRTSIPAYDDFKEHPNYYKLLADFSLYDSQGHYAPHRKVAYNMPATVPYLDANGNKQTMPTADYIQAELEKEMATRDELALQLADESDQGIIPQFRRALRDIAVPTRVTEPEGEVDNKLPVGGSSRVALADAEVKSIDDQYAFAVDRGDLEAAQQMVYEAADKAGFLDRGFHGTNGGDFYEFDWAETQRADAGWYGRGHYFATSKGEAAMYGSRVIPVALRISKPFNFEKEIFNIDGVPLSRGTSSNVITSGVAFAINMAEKFPNIFGDNTFSAYDNVNGTATDLRWTDLRKMLNSFMSDDGFRTIQYQDGHFEWMYDTGGWRTYFTHNNYATKADAQADKMSAAINLLFGEVYKANVPLSPEAYFLGGDMNASNAFSEELIRQGYTGVKQATDGDEIVVFNSNDIKDVSPVTYDDDGNVIPLSQRFNPESNDIRNKLPVGTSSRVALVDALEGLARRDEEKRLLNTYRTYIKNAQADQERLVKTRKEIARLRKEGDPNKRIPKLQQAVKTIQARLDRNDSALLELEGMEILKGIMQRAVREQRQMGEAQRRQMSEQYRADRADAVALQKATDADLHAMEQEFLRLMREYEKQGAKRSQLEGALAGKTADYQVMEKEFLRLMRAYEKESAKRVGLETDVAELGEDLESKKQENRDLRENQKLWEAEFRRLMTAYDRADRKVDRLEEQIQQMRDSRRRASERRKASEVRGKIKRLKARMQSTLLNPTEKNFVPVSLFETMVSVLELVDDSTEQYKPDGTLNQAQAAREATASRLNKLSRLYSEIKGTDGYQGEFDEHVDSYLRELADKYEGRNLAEMSLNELQDMYRILNSIYGVISEARKLIGMNERYDVYEAADAIAAEQQEITDGRKNGKRNFVGIANDTMNNHALSPMRNIERMSGYDEDSMLVKLFREIEKGVRKGNLFMMRAYKMFEELTASPEYDDALYKEVTVDGKTVEYTDYKGRKFGLSKMQMMQAILSYEREQAVDNLNHIATGGFTFADLRMLRKGKLKEAISEENSHRVPAATEMVLEFIEILKDDKWCQDYMAVAREFFNHMAKDAINEASIATKHRAVATGEAYVPFETDQNFVVKEISAANDVQQTINSYGMLKDTQNNAPQPLIVTGLNNLIERHISQVGTVYGLAVPIRNFNKVWTTKTQPGVDGAPTVRGLIEGNWGVKGAKHIEQAVQDVQGPRKRDQGVFADLYQKLKSNYIGATFLFNLSVVMKQLGSLFTATSMIQWRNPVSMMANLIYTATHFQEIAAEVDQYTASVWMRRQGLSDAELSTLMTEGQKTWLGKLAKKGPAWANPTKWITGMDSAVALSLWRYCKEDVAARTGLEGEALLEATAEFFDDVVENTQSMTDVLHRPEIQKNTNIFSEPFAMFKTDVYQMAGQLNVAAGRAFANPTKENKRALSKTVYSIAMSAVWGQLMTAAFAALRYKMDRYKDDEDELTWKSFLKRSLFSLGGDLAGYVFPIFGSEIVGIGEALAYGETDDFLDNMTMSNVNELYSMIIGISNAMVRGKEVSPQKWNKLIAKALQLFGVPTNNIIRLWEAIRKHAADIAEGEFFAFNEE